MVLRLSCKSEIMLNWILFFNRHESVHVLAA